MTADKLFVCVLVDSFGKLVRYDGRYVLEEEYDIVQALDANPDADAYEVTLTVGGVYMRGAVSDAEARKEMHSDMEYDDAHVWIEPSTD